MCPPCMPVLGKNVSKMPKLNKNIIFGQKQVFDHFLQNRKCDSPVYWPWKADVSDGFTLVCVYVCHVSYLENRSSDCNDFFLHNTTVDEA